jgi:hypothetical protein
MSAVGMYWAAMKGSGRRSDTKALQMGASWDTVVF